MSHVSVAVLAADERHILENLFQLYVHDFSENWAGTPQGELENDGKFSAYPWFDHYWQDKTRIPLLIRNDGHIAGFALLNAVGHTKAAVDRNMAEFFIVRKHRRSGVGSKAVDWIFRRYPGTWEVAVVRANTKAFAFWRNVIEHHPHVRDLDLMDVQTDAWNGPVFRFRAEG